VDTVRITWPNGLIQNETGLAVNRVAAIKEAPRLSGSCPMIFTWNGERFQFITDVLGVAPLGASSGDGQYFPVDHDEYVSIPGEALAGARRRVRHPRHRGTARGVVPRPDSSCWRWITRRASRSSPTRNSNRRRFRSSGCSAFT
jgi:hypothetical protein